MCGIIFMLSNDKHKGALARGKAFTQGIILDTLRGFHSTGLAYVDYDGNAEVYKKPVPGYDFVQLKKFQDIIKDPEKYPIMIAHNRWATKGKVNTENAHPFQHDHITGVHNGSLSTWRYLAPDEDFDTDSEHIFHALANNETPDVLRRIDGAAALVWHDATDNTVHVVRNEERPFYIVHIKNHELVFGASELEMLELMCARNNLDIEESYSVGEKNEFIFDIENLHKPRIISREMEDPYVWDGYYQRGTTYDNSGNRSSSTTKESTPVKVRGCLSEWHAYRTNQEYGYILGYAEDSPWGPIRINGVKETDFIAMDTKDGFFEGVTGLGGVDENGLVHTTLILKTLEWFTTEEAYGVPNGNTAADEETIIDVVVEGEEDAQAPVPKYRRGNVSYIERTAQLAIACGCGICGSPIPLSDFNDLEWWGESPICVDCDLDTAEHLMGYPSPI